MTASGVSALASDLIDPQRRLGQVLPTEQVGYCLEWWGGEPECGDAGHEPMADS
ncbi:MAG TPA: hypothetical protein VH879_13475 [Gemmatimonadales bacterium]